MTGSSGKSMIRGSAVRRSQNSVRALNPNTADGSGRWTDQ